MPTPGAPATVSIAEARSQGVGADVVVSGTVTVQAGRILGDRTLVIQDESGGLPVRLPIGLGREELGRGAIVWAAGRLSAPYGNLELRVDGGTDLGVIGDGGLPAPLPLGSAELVERNEGLLATVTATITDITLYASGAVSITAADGRGDVRIYAFSPIALERSSLAKGGRVRATGIVGQRASSSGAADGYRLWLRGANDLTVLADPPGATPAPTDDAGGGVPDAKPPRVRIKDATPGRTVSIRGVVTSKAGFIDSEGRRVTVEDRTGAILLRYPADVRPARVGSIIRATGEVDTWFDTPQLEADKRPRRKGRTRPSPSFLRRPPAESEEWRLVSVVARITAIERDGDTWRAEAALADGSLLPIVGLAGAAIRSDRLEPGRQLRVTGIVRRAHPSASDQRFAIAPRSRRDLRLGHLTDDGGGDDRDDDERDDDERDEEGVAGLRSAGSARDGDGSGVLAVTLGSLEGLDDRMVQVGGRVRAIAMRRLTIDDGTAIGVVRVPDGVAPVDPTLEVGEIVNAIGRVRVRGGGHREVVVDTADDVLRAAALIPDSSTAEHEGLTAPAFGVRTGAPGAPRSFDDTGNDDLGTLLPLTLLGVALVGSLLLVAAGVAAWHLRRQPTAS